MKYKINDKVKVITQEESSDKPYIGKTYEVEKAFSCSVSKGGYYLKGISSLSVLRDRLHFHEAQLEPVLETKFQVGDRVKIVNACTNPSTYNGWVGTILSINTGRHPLWVKYDDQKTIFSAPDEVEIISDTQIPQRAQIGDKFKMLHDYSSLKENDLVTLTCKKDELCNHSSRGSHSTYNHYQNEQGEWEPLNDDEVEPYLEATPPEPTHPNKCGFMGCRVYYSMREEPKKDDSDYQFYPLDSYSSFPVNPSDDRMFHYVKAGAMIFGNERYLASWDDFSNEKYPKEYKSGEESGVNNKNMALIIGEKYVPKDRTECRSYDAESDPAYIIITKIFSSGTLYYDIYDKDGNEVDKCNCFTKDNLVPYSPTGHKKGLMKTLSIMAAKLVDSDVKAFVEAGILDSELNITEVGCDFVLTQVLNDNKTKYATEARKIIAEEKKTKEGK